MTISTLLRHVGLHAPRGVSIDGHIVTGDALTSGLAAGTATALTPHTFHGGEEPDQDADAPAWWLDPQVHDLDVAAVRSAFPRFVLDEDDGRYTWTGTIDTGHGGFTVAIDGNPEHGLPRVRPVQPSLIGRNFGRQGFQKPHHMFLNGNLCVAEPDDFDPARDTTATVIAWVAHWYAAYVDWLVECRWTVDGYQPRATA